MQKYPVLKTAKQGFTLQPLQAKHISFLVKLLSEPEIQATLFRKPTVIDEEKEARALEKMYDKSPPKEITYVLTLGKLLSETYIGYVKIKLIDWTVKSCYLSVALLPNPEFRGQGYAKTCYDTFFDYLFSLGIMKIYGRTHENNTATIKLNEATGFRLIGRQSAFILYPNGTKQDDLLFERLNPELAKRAHVNTFANLHLSQLLTPVQGARLSGTITDSLLKDTIRNLTDTAQHPNQLVNRFISEVIDELKNELGAGKRPAEAASSRAMYYIELIAENARIGGYEFLGQPITRPQLASLMRTCKQLELTSNAQQSTTSNSEVLDLESAVWCGAQTESAWSYLRLLFLGKTITHSASSMMAKMTPQ